MIPTPSSVRSRRRWTGLVAVLAVTGLVATSQAQVPDAISHYRAGYELLRAKDFRNAAIELESAVTIDSTYGDAHYALGMAHAQLGDFDKSAQALQAALRHGMTNEALSQRVPALLADLYYKAALRSRQQRRFGEAIQRFETSLEYRPGNAQAHYTIALCYISLRQTDKAVPALRAAIAADAKYAWPYKSLGDIHRQNGDLKKAAEMYQKAIDVDPSLVQAYAGLAQVRIDGSDLEGAVQTLRKAVALDEEYVKGFVLLGTCLNQLQRHGEAIAPLRSAVGLDAEDPEARYRLAEALYGAGQFRDAATTAEAAVNLKNDFSAAQIVLADAHMQLGQLGDARRWYASAESDSRFRDYAAHKLEELDAAEAKAQGR